MFPYKPVGWVLLIIASLTVVINITNFVTGEHYHSYLRVRAETSAEKSAAILAAGIVVVILAISFIRKEDD